MAKHAGETGYQAALRVVEPGLMSRTQHSELPGNIRDIDSLVLRLMLAAKGSCVITERHCTGDDAYLSVPRSWNRKKAPTAEQVREALSLTGGKKGDAAKQLGCARTTLNRVLQRERVESHLG
jgi:DNA-binding NtrC family response regulator